jgi:hypothetical protein
MITEACARKTSAEACARKTSAEACARKTSAIGDGNCTDVDASRDGLIRYPGFGDHLVISSRLHSRHWTPLLDFIGACYDVCGLSESVLELPLEFSQSHRVCR